MTQSVKPCTNNCLVFKNIIQKLIVKDRLKFSDKDKGVMLIDGDPFLEVTVNMTSVNLVSIKVDQHGQDRISNDEGKDEIFGEKSLQWKKKFINLQYNTLLYLEIPC